jgi:hypothetical protein
LLACKNFARFFIPPSARKLRINDRIADGRMTDPILHEAQIRAGIEQVRGNGVLKRMEVTLALWNPGSFAIILDQLIESAAADGRVVAGQKQRRCTAVPFSEVGFKRFDFIGLQGMQPGKRVLEPVNPEAVLLLVEVIAA